MPTKILLGWSFFTVILNLVAGETGVHSPNRIRYSTSKAG